MKAELYNYDIFPKVFLENTPVQITVRPKGEHSAFNKNTLYTLKLYEISKGKLRDYPKGKNERVLEAFPCEDGCLRFTCEFSGEQEHFVRIFDGEKRVVQLSVYSLHHDMAGRYPYRGDLHMHTCRSDGREDPATVCANYRGHGYDFFAVTDHGRYYPSLEAIDFYKDVKLDFNIVPGEEVHVPFTDVHIVNFGGTYSVNGIIECKENYTEKGSDVKYRSLDGQCPDCLSPEEYEAQVKALARELDIPENIEEMSYAACVWAFRHIRNAGGLGIFAHPYWISDVQQVPSVFLEYMMSQQPFDAFEVLGGESYYQQNGFQTAHYYEDRAKGRNYPVVGSTDSHGSTEHNRNALVCSTIVFAEKNERESLIKAVKDFYSVAVDTIDPTARLVGDFRFVRFGSFLIDNFYPIHDALCAAEGEMMRMVIGGDERGKRLLEAAFGQVPELIKKYFAN